MRRFPRYTTFTQQDLYAELRKLAPDRAITVSRPSQPSSAILRELTAPVVWPDGRAGSIVYHREAPRYHKITAHYGLLPFAITARTRLLTTLKGELQVQEALKKAEAGLWQCFVADEIRDRFQRAAVGTGRYEARLPEGTKYQVKAEYAKDHAGRYALCVRVRDSKGFRLVPLLPLEEGAGGPFLCLVDANTAWRARVTEEPTMAGFPSAWVIVVAALCRLHRRWELPRFNALYSQQEARCPACDAAGYTEPGTLCATCEGLGVGCIEREEGEPV